MHWFGSLLSGSRAVLLRGVKPEWILRAVTEEKCTIVWLLVPWAQDLLDAIESGKVELDSYLLDQWRLMHIGAQPVPPSLIKRWKVLFPHHQYDTNYGLSESIGPGGSSSTPYPGTPPAKSRSRPSGRSTSTAVWWRRRPPIDRAVNLKESGKYGWILPLKSSCWPSSSA